MAFTILRRTACSAVKPMASGGLRIAAAPFRVFVAKVEAGTEIVAAAPNVSLQKGWSWDDGVPSKFATTPLTDIFRIDRSLFAAACA